MPTISKVPSRASIRRALTTLKKNGVIQDQGINLGEENDDAVITIVIDKALLSPKKSIRKRLPKVKKVPATYLDGTDVVL